MIRLLPDNDATGHLHLMLRALRREGWIGFWDDLETIVVSFEELGVARDASDREVWRVCQREQVLLLTNNRNADDPDSLEVVLREENRPDSLPVFTIGRPERFRRDAAYAERTALRLLEYLGRVESLRGAGRLFIP